jgi:iron complex transport system substrate-binding protein
MPAIPRRIVCLSAEAADVLYRLGAEELVVGVSAYACLAADAPPKTIVSGFTSVRYDVIESLKPDLVIGFSDLQADALCELAKRGHTVLVTNQRTLEETFATIGLIGRLASKAEQAEALVADLQSRMEEVRQSTRHDRRRPAVYFEEWDDPLISGIGWIGELVAAAGGVDAFPELSAVPVAHERVVHLESVIKRSPDIIIASWCGKRANLQAIRQRPGWSAIPAVRHNHVYELESQYCLQPGPALIVEGLPRIARLIRRWCDSQREPSAEI